MGETPERLKDAPGHEWPVTGYWCGVCGMPLHRILRAVGVHPTCEVQQAGHLDRPRQRQRRSHAEEGHG